MFVCTRGESVCRRVKVRMCAYTCVIYIHVYEYKYKRTLNTEIRIHLYYVCIRRSGNKREEHGPRGWTSPGHSPLASAIVIY